MAKNLGIILFFLATVALENAFAQINSRDELLRKEIRESGQARIIIKNPGQEKINELSRNVSVTAVRDDIVSITISPLTADWFISQNLDYEIVEKTDAKSVITAENAKGAMAWDKYPTYTQYDSIMRSFASLYPDNCLLDTIGTSIKGKLVLVLKISDNVKVDEDEPETFYSSTIHGDETGGFILMLHLADYMLKNYATNSRVRNLVDNLEIWINPLANPDGTYRTGNTISSPTRYNSNGYDLNRNFPDPETPNTVVQKETTDMVKFMRDHHFVISVNFHAGVEVVNYPWDRWYRRHPDDNWFFYISRKYADTVHIYSVPGYMTYLENGVTDGYDWYKVNGGRQDFMTWELQGREVTIELDYNYITPAASLNSLWQYNWHSLLGYLENARFGIHGVIKDAHSGMPVKAKVFIYGHDKDSSHVYSDQKTGRFVRLIAPGSWDLTLTAKGYVEKKVKDVIVTEGQATELTVEMEPLFNPVDTANTPVPVLYPNPAGDYIKIVMPHHQIGDVNIKIFSSAGIKLLDFDTITQEDIPLRIDLDGFSGGVYTLTVFNLNSGISNTGRFVVVHRE